MIKNFHFTTYYVTYVKQIAVAFRDISLRSQMVDFIDMIEMTATEEVLRQRPNMRYALLLSKRAKSKSSELSLDKHQTKPQKRRKKGKERDEKEDNG